MNRCIKCEEALEPQRVFALMDSNIPIEEWTCVKCSKVEAPFGFMSESVDLNGNASRKTGYILNILRPSDPDFKEKMRIAKRGIKRSR